MATTRADVTALRVRNEQVVTLAKRALARFWAGLDLARPEAARDALLQFMPQLVATYGEAAATVAADWYETTRAGQVPGSYSAVFADTPPAGQVQSNVRYKVGGLFSDDPGAVLALLDSTVQRHVVNTGRFTLLANAEQDRQRPRFARVPQGAKTCAFCCALASRGFVYHSAATAGQTRKFHDDCDCQIVADWSDDPSIDGYDPDELYRLYSSARTASGSQSINNIVAEMRRMHPDRFTDGIAGHHH